MKHKPKPDSDLILYLTEDGRTRLQVRLEGETVWLSLNQMVDLFQRDKSVISRHIKHIFEEGELVRDSVVAESATTAADGKTYQVEFYNLDVIISVGYRVKSKRFHDFFNLNERAILPDAAKVELRCFSAGWCEKLDSLWAQAFWWSSAGNGANGSGTRPPSAGDCRVPASGKWFRPSACV